MSSSRDLKDELDPMRSGLLAQAQAEFDYTILQDLHNQIPAGEEYKHKITTAIGDHFLEKGIDPAGLVFQIAGYAGNSIVTEEIEPNE